MSRLFGIALTAFSHSLNLSTGIRKTHFEMISCDEDSEVFRTLFWKKEGILLPPEYLGRAVKFFCKNHHGKIVGGFAIVLQGPFRALEQIPVDFLLPKNLILEEVNGLWLDNCSCVRRRIRFWTFAVGTVLQQQGNAIVYAVDSKKINLRQAMFNHIRSWTVYEGPVVDLEGMPALGTSYEAVEISHKRKLAKQALNCVGWYFSQALQGLLIKNKRPQFKFRQSGRVGTPL